MNWRSQLELFFGDTSPSLALVVARLPAAALPAGGTLVATLLGPECRTARTLPVRLGFDPPRARGQWLELHCRLTDPCFWSPATPLLYRVQIELREASGERQVVERLLGIRRFGVAGRNLRLDGKRWVLRAVAPAEVTPELLPAYRQVEATLLVDTPPDEVCEAASQMGLRLAVRLSCRDGLSEQLRRLSQWPAVWLVAIPGAPPALAEAPRNVVLAQWVDSPQEIVAGGEHWPAFVEVGASPEAFARRVNRSEAPVVAVRLVPPADVSRLRAGCDELQRELAAVGEFAGYAVIESADRPQRAGEGEPLRQKARDS